MSEKVALITGITGQDGSYLAELLLEKGYIVHGIKRRSSLFNTKRIEHILEDRHRDSARLFLHYGDLSDSSNLTRIINDCQPDEIYNLGAQSHLSVSFDSAEYTADDVMIRDLAELLVRVIGFDNEIIFDSEKADGAPRKLLDVRKINLLGWEASIGLEEGLASTYNWFLENQTKLRI